MAEILGDTDIQELIERTSEGVVPAELQEALERDIADVIERARRKIRLFDGRAPHETAVQAALRGWTQEHVITDEYEKFGELMHEQGYPTPPFGRFREIYAAWEEIRKRGLVIGAKVRVSGRCEKFIVGVRSDCRVLVARDPWKRRGCKPVSASSCEVIDMASE